MSESTTLNYNYTRGEGLQISDNHQNAVRVTPGSIPTITCNGTPQTIDFARASAQAERGLGLLDQGISALEDAAKKINPNAKPNGLAVLDSALEAARGAAGNIQHTSGTLSYEGQSPLTHLCREGQAAGVIR